MKRWIKKLVEQLDFDWPSDSEHMEKEYELSDERATLLYIIDAYNKHLVEVEGHPVRRVRAILDEFAKELLIPENPKAEKIFFRFRQFFSSYRIDEYAYVQKTFDEFREIIWEFVDQLGEDFAVEEVEDRKMWNNLTGLKDAVEANSIDELKVKSRTFIDSYVEYQSNKEERKTRRMTAMKKNLSTVKKKLVDANENLNKDHLTKAFNRKSFDEQMTKQWKLFRVAKNPVSIVSLDIDHFKKFNDTYGHAIGDFILVECVKLLKNVFSRDGDFVARVGGEEFVVILPDFRIEHAVKKAEQALEVIQKEVFIHESLELKFTASMGVAQLHEGEEIHDWLKRADEALYKSKNNGRNQITISYKTGDNESAA